MNAIPMKDVDADDPEVVELLADGWAHCGNDLWSKPFVDPGPVKRDTALRLKRVADVLFDRNVEGRNP